MKFDIKKTYHTARYQGRAQGMRLKMPPPAQALATSTPDPTRRCAFFPAASVDEAGPVVFFSGAIRNLLYIHFKATSAYATNQMSRVGPCSRSLFPLVICNGQTVHPSTHWRQKHGTQGHPAGNNSQTLQVIETMEKGIHISVPGHDRMAYTNFAAPTSPYAASNAYGALSLSSSKRLTFPIVSGPAGKLFLPFVFGGATVDNSSTVSPSFNPSFKSSLRKEALGGTRYVGDSPGG